ncbi:MAG: glycosyltransferase, exosortase A system-associated [Gammaproteobacteria bacterium]|nr:glycosyltransferase, exosortase A system-associated [Gammaproteobacteria bacterium]
MRVLHILDHSVPLHSGYTFRTRAILEQQRALGWETFQLTGTKQGKTGAAVEQVGELTFYRTQPSSGIMERLPVINQLAVVAGLERRLAEVIPEVKPDLLHAHSPALNGLSALRAARQSGIPFVYEVRAFWEDAAADHGTSREGGLRYRLTRSLETHVLKRASAVTTICEGLRGDIVARGIPARKVTVIPNAVDIERFSFGGQPDPARQQQLGLEGKTVLGFIGSFYAYEGLALLLRAMPGILKAAPDTCLLLVGGGPEEPRLKALADAAGLQDSVIFTGRVPHDEVQDYYNLVDIFVYPRLSMRLTDLVTPLKPLEAMAQGRLVLASDVGGHRELIRDGETGKLFHAGSIEDLQRTVLEMLRDRIGWQAQREAGRRFVETERTWEASVARYRDVYAAVLGQGNRV